MTRVASLYLPDWPIDRLRRIERTAAPPDAPPSFAPDSIESPTTTAAEEQRVQCSAPRGGGWRPGARWAKAEIAAQIARLPAHQRPPMRELGRRSEAAKPPYRVPYRPMLPYRSMRSDEGGPAPLFVRPAGVAIEPALATSIRRGNRLLIAAACPVARGMGIVPGMAVTQARASVSTLDIRPADPAGDAADLRHLAIAFARRWSPIVALSGADGLLIDITGTAHLFGGEARMAQRIVRLLARLGYAARIAVADSVGAAWGLARFAGNANVSICPQGAQRDAIAALPPAALRIDPAAVELLQRLGTERIAQLAAMPRAPLVRRFGTVLAMRLDQALGRAPEPLDPVVPPDHIAVTQRFPEPIATAEAIGHWLDRLLPRLIDALAEAGQGARVIELVAERIDGVPQRLRIGLARPSRDGPHIRRLIVRRIEEIAPGYGIDALTLHVRRADPLAPQPFAETLEQATPDLAPLIDTLANRIGDARLWRMTPVESDVPERSIASAAALDPLARPAARLRADDVRRLDARPPDHPWHPRWPRPVRLLRRPERIDHVIAELPDHAPRRFTWRGQTHRVIRADGPERIVGEWWQRTAERQSVRDYFRIEDDAGQRLWLFRRGDGERSVTGDLAWFVHGAFG